MTLCVAWKWEHRDEAKVCFAADTCVTFGNRRMKLGGVKILEVPLRYSTPAKQGSGKRESWTRVYGLGFTGNYVAAFLVKELVIEVLGDLQGIGGEEMTEFGRICELVAKFHAHFFTELAKATAYRQDIDFFFGGYCPVARKVRVARFYVDRATRTTRHEEILRKSGESFAFLGSAAAGRRFDQLINLSLSGDPCRVHFTAFRRLRDIIQSGRYRSVAGAIQYGEFEKDGNFRLIGTSMMKMGPIGPVMQTFIRGTDLDAVHQAKMPFDFHVGCSMVLPFHEDLAQFQHDSHYTEDGQRIMLDEVITVLPPDPKWSAAFMRERRRLRIALLIWNSIEHIGSTAVPNLPAIPVVDIMVAMPVSAVSKWRRNVLTWLGYADLGVQRNGAVHCFRKRGKWNFNVFFTAKGDEFWRIGLDLRQYLSAHPDVMADYGREKLRILNRGGWVLFRYNREKGAKLNDLVQRATRAEPAPSRALSWRIRAGAALWSWCRSWGPLTPDGRLFTDE